MTEDPCEEKHGGTWESVEAWQRELQVAPAQRRRVLQLIHERGRLGLTVKEAAEALGLGMNHISGRFTELRGTRQIVKTALRRDGGVVHVSNGPMMLGPQPKERDLLTR